MKVCTETSPANASTRLVLVTFRVPVIPSGPAEAAGEFFTAIQDVSACESTECMTGLSLMQFRQGLGSWPPTHLLNTRIGMTR